MHKKQKLLSNHSTHTHDKNALPPPHLFPLLLLPLFRSHAIYFRRLTSPQIRRSLQLRYAMLRFSTPFLFSGSASVDRSLERSCAGSGNFYWHILLVSSSSSFLLLIFRFPPFPSSFFLFLHPFSFLLWVCEWVCECWCSSFWWLFPPFLYVIQVKASFCGRFPSKLHRRGFYQEKERNIVRRSNE